MHMIVYAFLPQCEGLGLLEIVIDRFRSIRPLRIFVVIYALGLPLCGIGLLGRVCFRGII